MEVVYLCESGIFVWKWCIYVEVMYFCESGVFLTVENFQSLLLADQMHLIIQNLNVKIYVV